MNRFKVKIIIGANYGDECKGLATRYFAEQAKNTRCLNILFNGGCQRGHTVELKDGKKHVFHHFGSGSFSSSYNYFDQNFILNPIFFIEEYSDLLELGCEPICFASGSCRVSTPFDSFINQIVEDSRDTRHGSCGYGIWETQKRYEDNRYVFYLKDLNELSDDDLFEILSNIAHIYLPERLKYYGIEKIPNKYLQLISSNVLIERFIHDIRLMQKLVSIKDFNEVIKSFDELIFEAGQGLALDENNKKNYPNITASSTTSKIPLERIKDLDADVEICYVTRSYFTRHGAGLFPTECEKNNINSEIIDLTNVDNPYQESIRYGLFDKDEFLDRVVDDMNEAKNILCDVNFSLFVSHLNYTKNDLFGNCHLSELTIYFDKLYKSDTQYAEDVRKGRIRR